MIKIELDKTKNCKSKGKVSHTCFQNYQFYIQCRLIT